ncbi:type 1 glutamine amidotransferase [Paracoccaceae bacterium]|jgi:GMP synthase (glutamine-hydrolysing)|nr:glutamine amidotransferase [Marinovum sp.]MAV72129.1 glutamine amidotransferase [Marinovum sp.]MDB3930645.1 type 1 glutamine amidotransferase [Paracoccaceae bacterium]MDC0900259.1 type 1 glutamine amidotransferase [Paracoccaceae bacterium]|tara:strand:+ start:574 stop:1245 length:672 start_codon:yes stop_codon:yes gene_type:complete
MKIGILQTGKSHQSLLDKFGDYPDLFKTFLDSEDFVFETYPVLEMIFPKSSDECDGWLITGSRHGVYENHEWLPPLREFIKRIYKNKTPLVGICFGHQIIAQALGGVVEKFKGGWCVGATKYKFGDKDVTLNAWHQDQVIVPPANAKTVMTNEFCKFAGLNYDEKIITFQPHPEFNSDYVDGLIENRGRGIVPGSLLVAAKSKLHSSNDNDLLATKILSFFVK